MNKCIKCHQQYDPHKGATWLFCKECGSQRTKLFIKAQIGLMSRLHDISDDESFRAECMKRKFEYVGELQS